MIASRGTARPPVATLVAWLAMCWLAGSQAEAAVPPTPVARVGFGGVYRTGSWTPLVIEYATGAPAPRAACVWVEDPDGQYVRSPPAVVHAADGSAPRALFTVRFGRPVGRVLIEELRGDDDLPGAVMPQPADATAARGLPLLMLPPPLAAAESVMLVLGDLPAAERASRLMAREDGARPRVVVIGGAGEESGAVLGRTAHGFDGADAVIVCGRAVADFDPAVLRGIDEWVRLGGRLVFLAGASSLDVQQGGSAAAAWLPARVDRLVPLRRGSAIEAYARASRPLDKNAFSGLSMPLFRTPRGVEGVVEAFEGRGPADQPVVVRRAHGLGTIAWLGADIDRPPFRNWSGSDSLLVELLGGRATAKDAGRSADGQRGSLDLAGQLRQAIDRFPGVSPIPFEVIAGLGVLYVACLYPLDWWLASRRGSRVGGTSLAWLSLPVLVVLCSGMAWAAGQRWKAPAWQTSAAELVDVDVASGVVRANGYAGIWSPRNARLDVAAEAARRLLPLASARPESPADEVTWFAPCGRGIGGTDAAAPHPSLATAEYAYAAAASGESSGRLAGVPIAASSSRLFEAECTATVGGQPVESSLVKEGQGTLRGTVVNRLSFPLDDCFLAHAGWLYEVGRLEPGRAYDTGTGRGPRSLAGALTRRTTNRDREIAVRWNQAEADPLRILEIAGFHAAAGGRGYTGLEPGRLGRLDLSPMLPLDRAVLIGRGPNLVDWRCSAEVFGVDAPATVPPMPAATSLWRIVIPLARPSTSSTALVPESQVDDTP